MPQGRDHHALAGHGVEAWRTPSRMLPLMLPPSGPAVVTTTGHHGEKQPLNKHVPSKRNRLNALAITLNLIVPWIVFSVAMAVLSSRFRFVRPTLAWLTALSGFGMAGVAAYLGYRAKVRHQDPMWYTFSALALFVATAAGIVCGDLNFWFNMQPYYDIENLNAYPNVNPTRERGQQLMDAGRVYFQPGTHLDLRRTIGFKNLDTYCVAPIVHGNSALESYDFWAVGINCCSAVSSDFRCGEFNNPHARSGLRLMRDDQRPFFRLAVQQAEAAYNIKSYHPLFFYWIQDPVYTMNTYREAGFKYFLLAMFASMGFNCVCVGAAMMAFSKITRT
eukprot:TRINITY_DN74649_c0_g1_i1.p1 TRINITY_DN74649_c0_g1~~TRINITY_DN74649_c0_g1_i1.p1  ORF type:complete len:333 (-),score=42.41 TRINITY_DN74649_c0_g1_i1:79-1077(-)